MRYGEKQCTAGDITDNIANAHCIPTATNTRPEYVIRIAVRATMVVGTLLNVMSYVIYIACLV